MIFQNSRKPIFQDGRKAHKLFMKTDLVVAGYLIDKNKVLLVNHKKRDLWLPPGGHIKKNETPDDALKREFMEELNLNIDVVKEIGDSLCADIKKELAVPFYVNLHKVGDHDQCCLYYLCMSRNINTIKIRKSEIKSFKWFQAKDLSKKIIQADVRRIAKKAFEVRNKADESVIKYLY